MHGVTSTGRQRRHSAEDAQSFKECVDDIFFFLIFDWVFLGAILINSGEFTGEGCRVFLPPPPESFF